MELIGRREISDSLRRILSLTNIIKVDSNFLGDMPLSLSLILTHIPRTGGSTLDSVILALAASSERSWIRLAGDAYGQYWGDKKASIWESAEKNVMQLKTAGYVSGHMPYGIHKNLDAQPVYVTVLRHPVDRGWSQIRRIESSDPMVKNLAVKDFLIGNKFIDNQQVRMISGCNDPLLRCDEGMLDKAKKNLSEKYSLFGLFNKYDEFLSLLSKGLGWPSILFRSRNESVEMSDSPDEDTAKELLDHSIMDAELFKFAEKIYGLKSESFLKSFASRISSKRINANNLRLFSLDPFYVNKSSFGVLSDKNYNILLDSLKNLGIPIKEILV